MDESTQSVACGAISGLAMLPYSSSTIAMYILWKAIEVCRNFLKEILICHSFLAMLQSLGRKRTCSVIQIRESFALFGFDGYSHRKCDHRSKQTIYRSILLFWL